MNYLPYFKNILLLTILVVGFGCQQDNTIAPKDTIAYLRANLANPPSEYRSAPLWDWNEQVSKEGIDFQMKEFKKAGIGGVFVHPRPGLLTEYLSEEWFELFDYTVQKGKELDMKVWIYDENSYPSGFAGGHVPAEMPDSYKHGSALRMYTRETLDLFGYEDLEVVLMQDGDQFININGKLKDYQGKKGTYYIFEKAYPGKSPWYGGFSYVDLLYPGVTDKFLEVTMTNGYEKNKADFGKTLPGVFTDEPNLEAAMPRGSVMRWTPDLWKTFEERWGYDLKVNLPSLVEEVGDWKKVRHDYYELILEMFLDRWAKPWSEYCENNNLDWTGHYWEHGWPEPTHGFDEAAFYIWHQMPGVDMLGNKLDTLGLGGQFGNDRAIRELRSAANQAGRKRTLSETYGGGGWEMDFEEQKRLADWQCVLGVNYVNQHLSYYSLNGVRKFDYPPSFSYHEPWWQHYKIMGDYIGRISMATSLGEQINQTLVLQPTTTSWMYYSRKKKHERIQKIREGFKIFVYRLEQKHIEYDLGSENVLQTLGSVKENKISVGQRDYSLVVIPAEMENMDSSTLELLKTYLENGGKVLSFDINITRIDGKESEEAIQLAGNYKDQWINVSKLEDPAASELLFANIFEMKEIKPNGMLYHQRRQLEDGQLLFVVNSSKSKMATANITMEGKYVIKLDLLNSKESIYPATVKKGKARFDVELHPAESALFVLTNNKPTDLNKHQFSNEEKTMEGVGDMMVKRETDNVLVVNYLDIKSSKLVKNESYFMDALISLYNVNGVEMGNPWQHKIQYKKSYLELDSLFDDRSAFEANYHFEIANNVNKQTLESLKAVVERPELWQVFINGSEVSPVSGKNWIDKDFPLFEIGDFVRTGKNTLSIKAPRMHILAEVMPVYILGDFNVVPGDKGFKIEEGKIDKIGSWQKNGLPFYSQKVAYSRKFDVSKTEGSKYKVKLGDWAGSISEVWVNGKEVGTIAWQPYELDISNSLQEGENQITVKVYGSLKNTFGFFYHDNSSWIHGPHSWNRAPEKIPPADDYFLMDYGLFSSFDLVAYN